MTLRLLVLVLAACVPEGTATAPGAIPLSPRGQLIRLSVDLRGVHPSEDELIAIEQHPDLYDDYVARYLDDPRFVDRMAELFNTSFLTRTGDTWFDPAEAGLGGVDERAVAASLGDEPLALVRHVVAEDLPWTELITADYTMADPIVAAMWGLDRVDDGPGWVRATYRDGRPMAGVLSSTTLWQRYPSAGVNSNRHRANQVSRIFLCDDYLSRPVSFSRSQIDALTTADPNDVIADTDVCQSCHASLDPLSAHFYGFWWEVDEGLEDQSLYRPEDERLWSTTAGKSPAYFGRPTSGLVELGQEIASDERFVDCAVKTVYDGLAQRASADADWSDLQAHRDAFLDGGMTMRALVRSIVTDPVYRAGAFTDPALGERVPTVRTVSPSQLASVVEGITGYRWSFGGVDGLTQPDAGLMVLAGGIDSVSVTVPSHDPSVGAVFVHERLAQAAAWHVVNQDLDPERDGPARLLTLVDEASTPDSDPAAFDAQIRALYLQVTGYPLAPAATEPADLAALWWQLHSVDASTRAAWAGVVSVVLRDPAVLFY